MGEVEVEEWGAGFDARGVVGVPADGAEFDVARRAVLWRVVGDAAGFEQGVVDGLGFVGVGRDLEAGDGGGVLAFDEDLCVGDGCGGGFVVLQ